MGRESDSPKVIPGGAAIPDTTAVNIYRRTDLVTPVASTTISGGKYVHQYDGSYGPIQTRITYNTETRVRDSVALGLAGPISFGDFVFWMAGQGPGVSRNVRNQLAVTGGGAGKTVLVRSGAGAAAGILYNQFTDNKPSPVFADNVSGLTRIDLIGFQVWTPGHAEEGRAELAILQGTPAASPVAPSPTQTAENGTWFEPLAQISLPNGYSSITTGQITDRRRYIFEKVITDLVINSIVCGNGITCFGNYTTGILTIHVNPFTRIETDSLVNIAPNTIAALDVFCPAGYFSVGGSCGVPAGNIFEMPVWVLDSFLWGADGYRCVLQNNTGDYQSVATRAFCFSHPIG